MVAIEEFRNRSGPVAGEVVDVGLAEGEVPQLDCLAGWECRQYRVCVACGRMIDFDRDGDYLAARVGPRVLAVAHPRRWVGPGDDDWDEACENVLRTRWYDWVVAAGAGMLCLRRDRGGQRFFLGDQGLQAGTPIDVLDGEGGWLCGRFEYLTDSGRWRPRFHLVLGGADRPEAAMDLPVGAVVRLPDGR